MGGGKHTMVSMVTELLLNIWTVLLDTAFWLILGLLAAGLIKAFIPEHAMKRWVGGKGFGAVSRAALFGAPLPLCSCGVLPAAMGIHRAGASKEATVSFLISTPETSVDSVAVTYALMGPVMAVYRPVAALVSAVVTGLMTSLVDSRDAEKATSPAHTDAMHHRHEAAAHCCATEQPTTSSCCAEEPPAAASCCETETKTDCCSAEEHKPVSRWFQVMRFAGAELIDDIAVWLAIGIVIAGAMLTFIPPGWLATWGSGLSAMLIMLVVGIPLYICAVASTPMAAGLLLAGVSPGAVLVFLLVGPATNVTSFALVRKELGGKVTLVYFTGIAVISVAMGLLLEWLLVSYDLVIDAKIGHAHEMLPLWLSLGSAIILLLLAVKPVRQRLFPVLG